MKKKEIQKALPDGWVVTTCRKFNEKIRKEILEIQKGNEILSFEVSQINRYPGDRIFTLKSMQGGNKKEYRDILFSIYPRFFSDTILTTDCIRQLLSKEELVQLFGECEEQLHIPILKLDISQRGYYCLCTQAYETVFDIVWNTPEEIEKIPQLGGPAYKNIIEIINDLQVPWDIKNKIQPLLNHSMTEKTYIPKELHKCHYYGYILTEHPGYEQHKVIECFCKIHGLDFGFNGEKDNSYLAIGMKIKQTNIFSLKSASKKEKIRIQELQPIIESFFQTKLEPATYFLSHKLP